MSDTTSKSTVTSPSAPAPDPQAAAPAASSPSPARTFTQEQVNAIVAEASRKEREKFPDYDELKAKAEQLDQVQGATKTELQKAQDRAQKAEQAAQALLVEAVAAAKGVPAAHLSGTTREQLEASADALIAWRDANSSPAPAGPSAPTRQIHAPYVPTATTGSGHTSRGGSLQAGRERSAARRHSQS